MQHLDPQVVFLIDHNADAAVLAQHQQPAVGVFGEVRADFVLFHQRLALHRVHIVQPEKGEGVVPQMDGLQGLLHLGVQLLPLIPAKPAAEGETGYIPGQPDSSGQHHVLLGSRLLIPSIHSAFSFPC